MVHETEVKMYGCERSLCDARFTASAPAEEAAATARTLALAHEGRDSDHVVLFDGTEPQAVIAAVLMLGGIKAITNGSPVWTALELARCAAWNFRNKERLAGSTAPVIDNRTHEIRQMGALPAGTILPKDMVRPVASVGGIGA